MLSVRKNGGVSVCLCRVLSAGAVVLALGCRPTTGAVQATATIDEAPEQAPATTPSPGAPPEDAEAASETSAEPVESEVVSTKADGAAAPAEPSQAELGQCPVAQEKLIEIGGKVSPSVAEHMTRRQKAWIAACERRIAEGDEAFHRDLDCVAGSDDIDGLMRCDGWTDWPAM